jgi:lipopolysaccharide/colanic/teichoic acid biosynthesis glycosyltransferase
MQLEEMLLDPADVEPVGAGVPPDADVTSTRQLIGAQESNLEGYSRPEVVPKTRNWAKINHYSSRILIDPWFSAAWLVVGGPLTLLGALAVKIAEPNHPAFYWKQIRTIDNTEQYQLKVRTMAIDADDRVDELAYSGALESGIKADEDSRVTPIGRWLRRFSVDEYLQAGQILKHVLSRKGFFYKPGRHYHYVVAPRPQTEKTLRKASDKYRPYLSRGRTGLTGEYQTRYKIDGIRCSEGQSAERFHNHFETEWIIPHMLRDIARTYKTILFGHNS